MSANEHIPFTQEHRLFTLQFVSGSGIQDGVLLPYHLSGREAICEGLRYELSCLSADAHLELKQFIGVPTQLTIGTDDGGERSLCGIVTEARQEGGDGGFSRYTLVLQDPFAVLKLRRNARVFQELNARQFIAQILSEHRQSNPVLAECFDVRDQCIAQYGAQRWVTQFNESDSGFIQRWLADEGIAWFFEHGDHGQPSEHPRLTLVLFDEPMRLAKSPAGTVRFHRASAVEEGDAITEWHAARSLQAGAVQRNSFDYKQVTVNSQQSASRADQGGYGNRLAATLEDYHYDTSQYAENDGEYARYGKLRMQAYEYASKCFAGAGTQRQFAVGQWFSLADHPVAEQDAPEDRQFVLTEVSIDARNNLPVDLQLATRNLLQADRDPGGSYFHNRFQAVRRSVPIVPHFSHTEHAKPSAPPVMIGLVVGPSGEEIHTDPLGRIRVRMLFTRNQDHEHAHQAGAANSDGDSHWIPVAQLWSGSEYGGLHLPRVGDQVLISYVAGDIDRPIVTGTVYSGTRKPATFSHAGGLPGNKALSGIKSKMVKGSGANELLMDDSTGEQRIRTATDHGHSALNQGFLVHPRVGGVGEPRGEGFELRTDQYGALRAGKGMLISTHARDNAKSTHLDSQELNTQLRGSLDLSKTLSEASAGHQAEPLKANEGAEKLAKAAEATYRQAGGAGKAASVPGYEAPLLGLSSPEGVIASSPKLVQLVAGEHLHASSQLDTNIAVGRKLVMAVRDALSVFVAQLGIKLFAGKGKVEIQAQSDNIEATAQKDILIASTTANVKLAAANSILMTAGGAKIEIAGGNINIEAPGTVTYKGAKHNFEGPGGGNANMPPLPRMPIKPGEMVLEHLYENGKPIKDAKYVAKLADGSTRQGVLDGGGRAVLAGVPKGAAQIRYLVDPRQYEAKKDWYHVKDQGVTSLLDTL